MLLVTNNVPLPFDICPKCNDNHIAWLLLHFTTNLCSPTAQTLTMPIYSIASSKPIFTFNGQRHFLHICYVLIPCILSSQHSMFTLCFLHQIQRAIIFWLSLPAGYSRGFPSNYFLPHSKHGGQPRCGCVLSGWLPNEEGWTAHACTCCNVPTFACGLVLGIPHSTFYFYLYHYFCLRASLVVSTLVTDVEVVKVCPCGIFRLESSFLSWYSYLGWLSRCT